MAATSCLAVCLSAKMWCAPSTEVAKHYATDLSSYEETAREWTRTYACADSAAASGVTGGDAARLAGVRADIVAEYVQMGFPEDSVLATLRRLNVRGSKCVEADEHPKCLQGADSQ